MDETKYNDFIKKINLEKIELNSLMCNKNTSFDRSRELDIALEHDIKSIQKDGVELRVQIGFEVVAGESVGNEESIEDFQDESLLFRINFTLDLIYALKVDEEIDFLLGLDKEIKHFADNNVPVNAWPYAREMISSTTTRMGLPPLVIPPFIIGKF
ncbi:MULTISPECIES: protein-export chaperone SecB [Bacillus]|uniref:protein-export chaperone SecB n=1 Tax=Bacillus TaxID=1386 RepID=UPI0011A0864F|nr:protein-export chaperone SecB [Bacillus pumilus]MBU8727988.1 protein-export chaperone SecB [Bacillus pumilus]